MNGVNKVILVGTLGNDPDVRYGANDKVVTRLSIATSESWKDKNTGEKVSNTEWHRVTIFGRLAEIAGQYLKKGSRVYVEGKLKTSKYQDKNTGEDKYSTDIIVDISGTLQFLDKANEGGGSSNNRSDARSDVPFQSNNRPPQNNSATNNNQNNQNQPQNNSNKSSNNFFDDSFDDDIPF